MILSINNTAYEVDVDSATPLLWVIREQVGLTGTKFGCGIGQCGACTVQLDGVAIRSCLTPIQSAEGKEIITIEGIAPNETELHAIQQAWIEEQIPQCGYCQSGQIIAAHALLTNNAQPHRPPGNRAPPLELRLLALVVSWLVRFRSSFQIKQTYINSI